MNLRIAILPLVSAIVLAAASSARAEACLDASDEARALLTSRKLLDARTKLRTCADSACETDVRLVCEERLAEVLGRLPSVIFDIKDSSENDLANVGLTVDGVPHPEGALGAEITLDPGAHVFVFTRAGDHPVEKHLVLVEREKGRREHVRVGVVRPPEPPPIEQARSQTPPHPSSTEKPAWPGQLRTVGWLTAGVGAAGLGIGAAFGLSAIAQNDAANCDDSNVCDNPRARSEARDAARVSTVSFAIGAGLLGLGIGAVVWASRLGAPAWPRWVSVLGTQGFAGTF